MEHRPALFVAVVLTILGATPAVLGAGDSGVRPVGDGLPNPYPNRDVGWGQLPQGLKWGAVVGAIPGPDGNLHVLHRCFENSCVGRLEPPIVVFDSSGMLVKTWGAGMLAFPHGYYIDPTGHIWMTDAAGAGADTGGTPQGLGSQVLKLDMNGTVLMRIGRPGVAGDPEQGLLTQPTAVVTNRSGEIFVAEGHNGELANRISIFTPDGKFIRTIVAGGAAPGQVRIPHCLAFDARDYLYVCDRGNNRISIFKQDGELVAVWRQWGRPSGILIDGDMLYVTDSESGGTRNPGWRKGIRIGNVRSGEVSAFVPDPEATTDDPSGAEGISLYHGALFGAVVRRRELERFTK